MTAHPPEVDRPASVAQLGGDQGHSVGAAAAAVGMEDGGDQTVRRGHFLGKVAVQEQGDLFGASGVGVQGQGL